ncbi:MAG: hypothetical protein ACXW3X_07825 [Rhodoplanes sp.]
MPSTSGLAAGATACRPRRVCRSPGNFGAAISRVAKGLVVVVVASAAGDGRALGLAERW